jgi:predicted nucleic acid-binding protein
MEMNRTVFILVDADVIIHLFKADKISLLNDLYPGRIRMLDVVLAELLANRTVCKIVENMFNLKLAEEIAFPTSSNQAMFHEYLMLTRMHKGKGESACLVYCKHHKHIIASSNTKDILDFCETHDIAYLTTLDILSIALKRGMLTEAEINGLIRKITRNNESHLCCKSIGEHLNWHFKIDKLLY